MHGRGKLLYKNGEYYEGEFEYGLKHGKGTTFKHVSPTIDELCYKVWFRDEEQSAKCVWYKKKQEDD